MNKGKFAIKLWKRWLVVRIVERSTNDRDAANFERGNETFIKCMGRNFLV